MRIGFFGAGNMVRSLAFGFHQKNPHLEMHFYTPSKTKARELALQFNGILVEEIDLMPKDLDWYFLGFKPQNIDDFQFNFLENSKIVSLLAAIKIDKLNSKFVHTKFVRVMPNTPSRVQSAMNLIYFDQNKFSNSDQNQFSELFKSCGEIEILEEEKLIDLLTPYTGSLPGIIFEFSMYFENSLKEKLKKIDPHGKIDTRKLIAQTFLGTSKLMFEDLNKSFKDLSTEVTSKKGVTYEALETLRREDIEEKIDLSMTNALNRLNELSNNK
jgi:pyrroline-5-carboxylate reductase